MSKKDKALSPAPDSTETPPEAQSGDWADLELERCLGTELDLDSFLGEKLSTPKKVPVPQLGGYVLVRAYTFGDMQEIRKAAFVDGEFNEDLYNEQLFQFSVVKPQFSLEQVRVLKTEKSFAAFNCILQGIHRHNGTSADQLAAREKLFRSWGL